MQAIMKELQSTDLTVQSFNALLAI